LKLREIHKDLLQADSRKRNVIINLQRGSTFVPSLIRSLSATIFQCACFLWWLGEGSWRPQWSCS